MIFTTFAIRTSWFQTWLANQASAYYSKEFGTAVNIDKVDIKFVDRVDLLGVYVEDIRKDTFIYAETIHADIGDWSIKESFVDVNKATLVNGHIHIRVYEGDSTMNFQHIVDYFATEEEDTTTSDFALSVAKIELSDIHFIMEDQNTEPTKKGMDFANIDISHLNGGFSNFWMKGTEIGISLDDLSFVDRSGLSLHKLSGDLQVGANSIGLKKFQIGLNRTLLQGDFLSFEINDPTDWADFVNKVQINSHLSNSVLYLSDLAYFVPNLWGIQGDVRINNLETKGAVNGLSVKNLDLQILDTTRIMGNFNYPRKGEIYEEEITLFRTSVDDIANMGLDNILDEDGKKALNDVLVQYAPADIITLKNGSMIGGVENFVVDGDVYTGIGNVDLNHGLNFVWNEAEQIYYYHGAQNEKWGLIRVEELNMGVIAGNKMLDRITGSVQVEGKGFDEASLDIKFNGGLDKIGIYGYDYHGVQIREGSFAHNDFRGIVTVEDDNLALVYNGLVHTKEPMHFDFTVEIDSAHIAELSGKKKGIYQRINSSVEVDIHGTDVNQFYGDVIVTDFAYRDSSLDLAMDKMTLHVSRSPKNDTVSVDSIILRSPFVDMDLFGNYDLNDPTHAITEQFSYVMNYIIQDSDKSKSVGNENYELSLKLKNLDPVMKFIGDDIHIATDTEIRSEFFHDKKSFALDVNSSQIKYGNMVFNDIKIENHFDSIKAKLDYSSDEIYASDSLAVRDFNFNSKIEDNKFVTLTGWDGMFGTEPALFAFQTSIDSSKNILTEFRPSFFFLKGHKYDVSRESSILYHYENEKIGFKDFEISHKDNFIALNGIVSKDPDDWLQLTVNNFNLSDLNGLTGDLELAGRLNVKGKLGDIYNTPKFEAFSSISGLHLNSNLVGDIRLDSRWNEGSKSIFAKGELSRDDKRTFSFKGDYYVEKETDNLDFEATFSNTDIGFLKAFEDPELYTDIEGVLDGKLEISGEPDNPVVKGKMEILSSSVKVPMFNVSFGASGIIKMNDGEIIADHLRIHDQEYNMADCQMQVYHYDWADFNYNILLDMENPAMSNKFLAMDTYYKEGDYYYGKAYVSGMVSIFGYEDLTEITVDVKTEKGTSLVLPMYGSSELEEGSFIIFDETFFLPDSLKNQEIADQVKKVKRYGMTLEMHFDVTKDAEVKIVFDPILEDQIISKGEGNIEINMDDFGDMTMFGEYVIRDGKYEMRIKQVVSEDFILKNGSIVQWTGSPYDAQINIQALFERNISLADIIPPETAQNRKKEQVFGVLSMTNTLMSPELSFDINAPKTDDIGKKAINEVKANPDELNKQFFALLVLKRFLPKYGGAAGGGSAVLGVAEAQINSVLSGVSENYDLKAGLSENQTTLGFETALNDRTTITTSFGVLADDNGDGGNIVGDVDIEYRLNDDGSFTMNFFNETNSSSITTQGNYTQGISLHYQETFNTTKQFRLWQKFLNLFRKKENRVKFESKEKMNPKYVPVPTDTTTTN